MRAGPGSPPPSRGKVGSYWRFAAGDFCLLQVRMRKDLQRRLRAFCAARDTTLMEFVTIAVVETMNRILSAERRNGERSLDADFALPPPCDPRRGERLSLR